jgi:hypothetical protein
MARLFGDGYRDTHELAEEGVRFVLDCEAQERGQQAPATYPAIEHFVPAPA